MKRKEFVDLPIDGALPFRARSEALPIPKPPISPRSPRVQLFARGMKIRPPTMGSTKAGVVLFHGYNWDADFPVNVIVPPAAEDIGPTRCSSQPIGDGEFYQGLGHLELPRSGKGPSGVVLIFFQLGNHFRPP